MEGGSRKIYYSNGNVVYGRFRFSENLGENIFHLDEDEVVLCLNYDGKFGLNNMNQYFQNANTNSKAFSWEEWSYKIGDRIIFTNTRRSTYCITI